MTWFLQFVFWFAIGAIGSGVSVTLYLISALRRVELFPSFTGAVVVAGVLLVIMVRCAAWAQGNKGRQEAVETFSIEEPAFNLIGSR